MQTNRLYSGGRAGTWYGWFAAAAGLVVLLAVFTAQPAHALTSLSQGFLTKDSLALGSLVSLKQDSSDEVIAANSGNVANLLGVVVDTNNSLLSVSDGQANQVQVATGGVVQVLVSDINGTVHTGDQITASPMDGVGMKASSNSKVIGAAQAGMADTGSITKASYTDKSGQKHDVQLSQIPVLISVSYFYKTPDKTLIPSAVQNVANALAGRSVSSLPILISMGIFFITIIVVASIVYSMIRSSIISVGRNPLSQSAIYRDIVQLSSLVIAILGVAMVSIYLILKKF